MGCLGQRRDQVRKIGAKQNSSTWLKRRRRGRPSVASTSDNHPRRTSGPGQSRLGGASRRSSHVRNAPLATLGPKKAACRDGPCVDGSELARRIFTSQSWSVQPCVRPLSAVHMTAGHNALRGSGPGQKPAFENALALVGCPDRRIDRLCITCCSPSQPSHHAMVLGAISSDPQRGWIIVSLAPGHHGPGHSGELVG